MDRRRFLKYAGAGIVAVAAAAVGYYSWRKPEEAEQNSKREYVVSLVNEAVNLIEKKGEESFPEFRQKGSKWFHDDYYIYVWRIDGIRVVYPPDPSGEGTDQSNVQDYKGKPIGRMIIDIAKSEKGEGWLDYEWPKPDETKPSGFGDQPHRKYVFIKRAKIGDQIYIVSSGYYE